MCESTGRPVIMLSNDDQANLLLEAKRNDLEAYLIRGANEELFTDLLAEEIYTQLIRYVEPPTMSSPNAGEMYRYAQYHNALEPFFVVARKRYLLYLNKAGRDLIYSIRGSNPYVGDPLTEWVLEESLEKFQRTIDRAFAGHEVVHERRFSELSERGMRELHYQPVTDPTGRVVAVSICVHLSEQPELRRAWFMQKTADLLAWVSHEHNNLLNILMSNADLLSIRLAELGDEEALNRLKVIESAIERSVKSAEQMQAFSRTGVTQPERLELNTLIETLSETLHESLNSELAADIELILQLDHNLPDIYADPKHWKTVVTNLLRNGAEDMVDGGQIRLRTCAVQVSRKHPDLPVDPGSYVLLEFLFDGQIMADWLQDRRFDPFFTMRKKEGYGGLELAAVKSIIDQGGGQIVLTSSENQTAVQVYYPVYGETEP